MLPEMQRTRCGTEADVTVQNRSMAITLALAAALGYAVASVLQHRAAAAVPRAFSMRIGLLTRLLSRPLWLLGVGVDLSAFCFEAWALAVGSLAVVQPVLVLGLPVALVLGAVVARERFGRREALGSVAVCGGLVMFLTVSTPSRGHELAAVGRWVVVVVVLGISVAACLIAAARQSRWRAAWSCWPGRRWPNRLTRRRRRRRRRRVRVRPTRPRTATWPGEAARPDRGHRGRPAGHLLNRATRSRRSTARTPASTAPCGGSW